MAPLPNALLLLSLALYSLAFSFRSSSPPPTDLLAGAFPPNARHAPSYSTVLQYLSTLETAPSCHREATTSLISDCSILEASHSDLRYRYASRLAVCEFEATGVNYPSECHNGRHEKCIKRLEERPQWWTTLSNNIQNVLVICAAVRHEVEEGRILELHRNATRAQEMLVKVAHGALQSMKAQQDREELDKREFGEGWREILEGVKTEMMELQVDAKMRAKEDGEALKRMFDRLLQRVIHGHEEYSERLEELAVVSGQAMQIQTLAL
ncbi:Tht1-like nuclear fusion protein-domain-containing protein [Pyronema omphalodes]|nr:Tht1-like nuclear fusion protein-domain-containing protein [Pyronema omphalodes]